MTLVFLLAVGFAAGVALLVCVAGGVAAQVRLTGRSVVAVTNSVGIVRRMAVWPFRVVCRVGRMVACMSPMGIIAGAEMDFRDS